MKHLAKLSATFPVFFAFTTQAMAQTCTFNGVERPCGEMPPAFWFIICCSSILAVTLSVFWIWMLVDLLKSKNENKVVWLLVLIFLNLFGSILYYLMGRQK